MANLIKLIVNVHFLPVTATNVGTQGPLHSNASRLIAQVRARARARARGGARVCRLDIGLGLGVGLAS